jgi:hypothetical protein
MMRPLLAFGSPSNIGPVSGWMCARSIFTFRSRSAKSLRRRHDLPVTQAGERPEQHDQAVPALDCFS